LQDEASSFLKAFSKKKKLCALGKTVLDAAIWHIWSEINKRIFQLQESSKFEVARLVQEDVNTLMKNCS